MMERNLELFCKIADQIEEHPETYSQHEWACGTHGCIAGWALVFSHFVLNLAELERYIAAGRAHVAATAATALGLRYRDDLETSEAALLFNGAWEPHEGLSVPDALRKIGEGAEIRDVTRPGWDAECLEFDDVDV